MPRTIPRLLLPMPSFWPMRRNAEPAPLPEAGVTITDALSGAATTTGTFQKCEARLTLNWSGGRANGATLRAVWQQDPRYFVYLYKYDQTGNIRLFNGVPYLPVSTLPDGRLEADATLITWIGVYHPGEYRLEGTTFRTFSVPWFGTVAKDVNAAVSRPFELPKDPEDRCAA